MNLFIYRLELVIYLRTVCVTSVLAHCTVIHSAYHHIMIKSEMRTYLGFSVDYDGVDRFFVYNVAPFGLATSGFIFSKVLRVLVAYWRGQGHKVIMFLDDGIGGHPNYEMAVKLSQYIKICLD